MNRGDLRWYTFRLPDKRRPVLIPTRSALVEHLNELIVVPVTRTIRGLSTEVLLTQEDGMPVSCALNFDHVSLAQRDRLGPAIARLRDAKWSEVRSALLAACGLEASDAG